MRLYVNWFFPENSKLLKHIDGVGSNNWYPVFLWVPPGSAFVWPHTKDSSIIVIFRSTFDCSMDYNDIYFWNGPFFSTPGDFIAASEYDLCRPCFLRSAKITHWSFFCLTWPYLYRYDNSDVEEKEWLFGNVVKDSSESKYPIHFLGKLMSIGIWNGVTAFPNGDRP